MAINVERISPVQAAKVLEAEEVALHFAHYNFVRLHSSLRVTPAMAAGVASSLWSMQELVERTST